MLSQAFAERHGLKIGDHFPIFTSHGKKDFAVEGIFKPTGVGEVFGGNIAVMDIYSAQVVFDRGHNFDRIDLMNAPGVSVNDLQQRLKARLPAGIEVMRPEMKGQALENAVTAMRLGMMITSFIALLVGVYIIFNSFTIAVNQRWKEIGILRAVGVERGNINAMFLGEALLMGVVGSIAGIALGYYMATVANTGDGIDCGFGVWDCFDRGGAEAASGPGSDLVWAGRGGFAGRGVDAGAGGVVSRSDSGAAQH